MIAEEIEKLIISKGWPVGESIGSEPDLMERYQVSRSVFREAVRIIEHHNVARMRRGPGGGLIVAEPDFRSVRDAAAIYLRYVGVELVDIFEARLQLELACVADTTATITEEGIERLRDVLIMEKALDESAPASVHGSLHTVIAQLCGNPAMSLFAQVLIAMVDTFSTEEVWATARNRENDSEDLRGTYHHAHKAIVDAIVQGDASLAQHRMRAHLAAIAAAYAEVEPD